ncbi:hypothetical protein CW354_00385 [Marinicaulis flavus]|uniref:Uncharacterized protein n=2 Tax=Hyphococcus luteus TaxID=2058213 RepID=A0A2S7KA96_9PROT|nr:hypothetical protein CW354_00385 [Marinicaulis flavus]
MLIICQMLRNSRFFHGLWNLLQNRLIYLKRGLNFSSPQAAFDVRQRPFEAAPGLALKENRRRKAGAAPALQNDQM